MPASLVTSSSIVRRATSSSSAFGSRLSSFKVCVESAPIHAFHWPTVVRENRRDAVDDRPEVAPQSRGGPVELVPGHVFLDRLAVVLDPLDCGFEVLLAFCPPIQIPVADCVSRAGGPLPAEIPLRVGHPRTCVDRVPQLLVGQLFARDVDDPKPCELLAGRPRADINVQRVIEKSAPARRLAG